MCNVLLALNLETGLLPKSRTGISVSHMLVGSCSILQQLYSVSFSVYAYELMHFPIWRS